LAETDFEADLVYQDIYQICFNGRRDSDETAVYDSRAEESDDEDTQTGYSAAVSSYAEQGALWSEIREDIVESALEWWINYNHLAGTPGYENREIWEGDDDKFD